MKESIKMVFQCDHCAKKYFRKHACARHEAYCGKNPANHHACFECKFLERDEVRNDDGYYEKTFRCTKLEKDLHTFKAERIGHSCLGYTERMPLTCPDYKHELLALAGF